MEWSGRSDTFNVHILAFFSILQSFKFLMLAFIQLLYVG